MSLKILFISSNYVIKRAILREFLKIAVAGVPLGIRF